MESNFQRLLHKIISEMEWKFNLLQVKRCNVLFTEMKSFKIFYLSLHFTTMGWGKRHSEGSRGGSLGSDENRAFLWNAVYCDGLHGWKDYPQWQQCHGDRCMQSKAGALFRTDIHSYPHAIHTHIHSNRCGCDVKVKNCKGVKQNMFPTVNVVRIWSYTAYTLRAEKHLKNVI